MPGLCQLELLPYGPWQVMLGSAFGLRHRDADSEHVRSSAVNGLHSLSATVQQTWEIWEMDVTPQGSAVGSHRAMGEVHRRTGCLWNGVSSSAFFN